MIVNNMCILNALRHKLPDKKVVWCIGVPYTKEQFYECAHNGSDFIDSLEVSYGVYDQIEMLWEMYRETADLIRQTKEELKTLNVKIVDLHSMGSVKETYACEVIILTMHRHRLLDALDFMGTNVLINDFISVFQDDYQRTIDMSSCYSAEFQQKFKLHVPHSRIISANTESSLKLRLFIYRHVVKQMAHNPSLSYLDAYELIASKIVAYSKQLGTRSHNVHLGGKVKSIIKHRYPTQSASVFAPAMVVKNSIMLAQVYVYWEEEHDEIIAKSKLSDEYAIERAKSSLDLKLKKDDKVRISMQIPELNVNKYEDIVWQERYTKRTFVVEIPKHFTHGMITCILVASVNGAIIGNMCFQTKVVTKKEYDFVCVEACYTNYKKVFISYSHEDYDKVKYIDTAYNAVNIDHFFDRTYLKVGDVYPKKISDYIANADLFILCWSENAKKSQYVPLEIAAALKRASPNVGTNDTPLEIHPLDIEPHAELPEEMNKVYHFGRL